MSDLVTRLREDASVVEIAGFLDGANRIRNAADRIEQLEQEAAANKQDAMRYRYLRKVGCPLLVVKPSSAYGDLQMDEATLDRAIDAALKEGK